MLLVLVVACGSPPAAEETDGLRRGQDATLTQQQTLAAADAMFDFDPTLDPTKTAQQNAAAIAARTMSSLPCAMVSASGTTVTVVASNCSGENGVTLSGTITASVVKTDSPATLTVTLTFTNVVLNGSAVSGTMSMTTSNGTTFQVTYDLTRANETVTGMLTAVGAPGQITTSGTIVNGGTSALLTSVVWKKGDCYPSNGTLAVTVGRVTTTYTFSSSTPSTGVVTTARGAKLQLPAYGSCPSQDGGRP
ncbi:MAG: hypothetical protein SFW67_15315 [Myxococcaceae bacterium]|nr:hypothetical protein [Myxococcaceae bacterium]